MSPWDFEPIDQTNLPSQRGGSITVRTNELRLFMYQPLPTEWPPCGRDMECDRLSRGFEQIMELGVAESFLTPVDLNSFPIYAMVIEYPVDLSLIKARLEHRFYRRVNALQYDVRYTESNAISFNEPTSEIVYKAKLVTELCLRLVSDTDCTDIMPIYNKLVREPAYAPALSGSTQGTRRGKRNRDRNNRGGQVSTITKKSYFQAKEK